jgi:peptide/nickel transport system ATP-binding protein
VTALVLRDLAVAYGGTPVLHGVSLTVEPGECVGLVGESGCGKSTVALAALRALPRGGRITGGTIHIAGQDVTGLRGAALRRLWARHVSMVYQDPSRALNPTLTIGAQLAECFTVLGAARAAARGSTMQALARVRIADPARVAASYPHQLSGGMQQRVVIAMALAKNPALLVLDEPTTGLDATVEAGMLDLIAALRRDSGAAVLLISHNLPMVARMAGRVGVLYAGALVEEGPTAALLAQPRHPYTDRLLRCLPGGRRKQDGPLDTIPGALPPPGARPPGCVFAPRCHVARPVCDTAPPRRGPADHRALCHFDPPFAAPAAAAPIAAPVAQESDIVLATQHVSKTYGAGLRAVSDVSLALAAGETLGLVGESGSGKTTLARLLLGLVAPDAGGAMTLCGHAVSARLAGRSRADRRALQIVFQNPDSALNRAQTVRTILARPLAQLMGLRGEALTQRVDALAAAVRLTPRQLRQRPTALSGGQKQRVAIARAFAGAPRLVLCDEPSSALDVSVQAAILNLLVDWQRRERAAYLFISHDLNVVRYVADRIAVLYRGHVVEIGPAGAVFAGPNHPYTGGLLRHVKESSGGNVPPPPGPPSGMGPRMHNDGGAKGGGTPPPACPFLPLCPRRLGAICETTRPPLAGVPHAIACHIPRAEL